MNNKIIQYLDNQLSPEERMKFEIEIKNSKELQIELQSAKKYLAQIDIYNDVNLDYSKEFVFAKKKQNSYIFSPKLAFSTIVLVIISSVLFLVLNKEAKITNNNIVDTLFTQNGKIQKVDSSIDMNVVEEISTEGDNIVIEYDESSALAGEIDYNQISDEEAENIIKELESSNILEKN